MHCVFTPKPGSPQGWNVLQQKEEVWKFALRSPRETRLWEHLEEHSLCLPGFPSVAQKCSLLLFIRAVWKHPRQSWSCSKRAWQGCGPGFNRKSAALEDLGFLKGGSGLELWHQ